MSTFLIQSSRVLLGEKGQPEAASVFVRDGKIAAIFRAGEAVSAEAAKARAVNVGNELVMAGIVDTHAHINEPGRTDWEGFQTATRAAAAGGITTVVDMPLNSIPATTSLEALRVKQASAADQCSIDYGFWGGVVPGNADELPAMVDAGALGFKAFLCESGVDEFRMCGEKELLEAMPLLAKAGVPLLVHAELDDGTTRAYDGSSSREYRHYLESRPASWEVQAIRMIIQLAKKTGCRVHIVHLSAAEALRDIVEAKKSGVPISVETCPHYLFFESDRIFPGATEFKCSPPIRDHGNREALWKGLKDRSIDFVVSDHSPCTPNLKARESGEFSRAWGGISGLQFSMPVVWTEMKRRGHSLRDLTTWMSLETSRFARVHHSKGQISVGFDADLVVWNPEAQASVEAASIQHKNKLTPYEGAKLFGKISQTFVRGQLVYVRDGDHGKFPGQSIGRQIRSSS